jgi:extradiol dioxygenase family protein
MLPHIKDIPNTVPITSTVLKLDIGFTRDLSIRYSVYGHRVAHAASIYKEFSKEKGHVGFIEISN